MRWLVAAASIIVAGCGGEVPQGAETDAAKPAEAAAPAALAPEFIQLKGENVFFMIIPAGLDPAEFKPLAKDRCGEVEFCKVYAWTDRASAARALPMTEAELASQAFSYGVNRAPGFEIAAWDCKRFPQADKANCL